MVPEYLRSNQLAKDRTELKGKQKSFQPRRVSWSATGLGSLGWGFPRTDETLENQYYVSSALLHTQVSPRSFESS